MGTIRLGKRTDNNAPLIKDFVPLADLNDLVFTGWDIFEDNVYEAAAHAEVLDKQTLDQLKPYLETIKPMPAVFDQYYVKRLHGTHVKKGKNKRDLADQVVADIRNFKKTVDRVVMIWARRRKSSSSRRLCIRASRPLKRAWKTTTSALRLRRFMPMRR